MAIQAISRDELLKLLAAAREHRKRDWVIMLVKYWHGLRISEILALRPDFAPADAKPKCWVKDGFLTVQRLKGSLKTCQPLISSDEPLLDEAAALPAYFADANVSPGCRAFPITRQYFWKIFGVYAASVGIPAHKHHPHVLKHSIGAHSIKTAGIENLRQHMGHRSMSSTGEYLRVPDDVATSAVAGSIGGPVVQNVQPVQPSKDRYSAAAKKAWETRRARRLNHER